MSETWEQTKTRLKKHGFNLSTGIIEIASPKPLKQWQEEKSEPSVKRFNIHKRSLPLGIDKIVVFNVMKQAAEWWVEYILKTKVYHREPEETKTLIYFDIIPVDATPKERSIYYNRESIKTEEK